MCVVVVFSSRNGNKVFDVFRIGLAQGSDEKVFCEQEDDVRMYTKKHKQNRSCWICLAKTVRIEVVWTLWQCAHNWLTVVAASIRKPLQLDVSSCRARRDPHQPSHTQRVCLYAHARERIYYIGLYMLFMCIVYAVYVMLNRLGETVRERENEICSIHGAEGDCHIHTT